jgi:hypothetical protein
MHYLYILLSRTETVVSRVIGTFTGDSFTHASISLDRELSLMYSFARRKVSNPVIGGFIHEDIDTGIFARNHDCPCRVYRLAVSDRDYRRIERRIAFMEAHSAMFGYNILGLLFCAVGIPLKRRRKFYCSQFVGSILGMTESVTLPKDPFCMKPEDFIEITDAVLVYSGPLCNSRSEAYAGASQQSVL